MPHCVQLRLKCHAPQIGKPAPGHCGGQKPTAAERPGALRLRRQRTLGKRCAVSVGFFPQLMRGQLKKTPIIAAQAYFLTHSRRKDLAPAGKTPGPVPALRLLPQTPGCGADGGR